eukprot:GHVT01076816.1.p1 GENE.GHVT01076816.1~~GHVT01076816.1.p1  ORF type:complete len:299 (+),score=54.17 GHVT01076816.1:1090-1986(+)
MSARCMGSRRASAFGSGAVRRWCRLVAVLMLLEASLQIISGGAAASPGRRLLPGFLRPEPHEFPTVAPFTPGVLQGRKPNIAALSTRPPYAPSPAALQTNLSLLDPAFVAAFQPQLQRHTQNQAASNSQENSPGDGGPRRPGSSLRAPLTEEAPTALSTDAASPVNATPTAPAQTPIDTPSNLQLQQSDSQDANNHRQTQEVEQAAASTDGAHAALAVFMQQLASSERTGSNTTSLSVASASLEWESDGGAAFPLYNETRDLVLRPLQQQQSSEKAAVPLVPETVKAAPGATRNLFSL